MRVLLVGGGGREHAIAEAIKKSGKKPELYAAMSRKNPGIAKLCEDFLLCKETEVSAIVDYGIRKKIELAFIGPEAPLAAGLADALEDIGIPGVGPRKTAAKIEFDKAWAREFMKKYDIGGLPVFKVFDKNSAEVGAFIERLENVAVKPSGLTGGKGVRIMGDHFRNTKEAKAYAKEVLKSDRVVVEERLLGEEFTVQAFVDGESLAYASAVQDHKRAYEGDLGPNTGGMGSYNDAKDILPFMEPKDYEDAKKIMQETVLAIKRETGIPYKGILYGQFMLTAKGIKVLEFNARLGDPEAMNVLPLLRTDFLDIAETIVEGRLSELEVEFARLATVCKYAVPAGYPENPAMDTLVEVGDIGDALLYYSSVYEKDGQVYTTGSRAIAVVGIAETISKAERKAEAALLKIKGNLQSRHDIGTSQLIQKRIDHMREIRGYPTKSSLKNR